MVNKYLRAVAYICPYCSGITEMNINIFSFSGDSAVYLKCNDKICRESIGMITPHDDKYKISLLCPLCDEVHTYTISKASLWSLDYLSFSCPNSGIDIFFSGERKRVLDAVNENNRMLDELADEYERRQSELSLKSRIVDLLKKKSQHNKVRCKCGSSNVKLFDFQDKTFIRCSECGREFSITASYEVADKLSDDSTFIF